MATKLDYMHAGGSTRFHIDAQHEPRHSCKYASRYFENNDVTRATAVSNSRNTGCTCCESSGDSAAPTTPHSPPSPSPPTSTTRQEVLRREEQEEGDSAARGDVVEICQRTVNPPHCKLAVHDFHIHKLIGKGGYGKVFLVSRTKQDGLSAAPTTKYYAMKVLRKARLIRNEKDTAHTLSERNILEMIRHPFLVKLHYAFQNASHLYICLEYCPGGELFTYLEKEETLQEPSACFYISEISLAIGHLHSKGIIYRDLKPENVLLDEQGHVKLTDFGLSKESADGGDTLTHTYCGTIEYMAPEIILRQGHTKQVDWWSLGTLLFDMLSGGPPFSQESNKQQTIEKIRLAQVKYPAHFSKEVRSLLQALLTRNPQTRLGARRDVEELKEHRFFAKHGVNWDDVLAKQVAPPYIPVLSSETDVSCFDPNFTDLQPIMSPPDEHHSAAAALLLANHSAATAGVNATANGNAAATLIKNDNNNNKSTAGQHEETSDGDRHSLFSGFSYGGGATFDERLRIIDQHHPSSPTPHTQQKDQSNGNDVTHDGSNHYLLQHHHQHQHHHHADTAKRKSSGCNCDDYESSKEGEEEEPHDATDSEDDVGDWHFPVDGISKKTQNVISTNKKQKNLLDVIPSSENKFAVPSSTSSSSLSSSTAARKSDKQNNPDNHDHNHQSNRKLAGDTSNSFYKSANHSEDAEMLHRSVSMLAQSQAIPIGRGSAAETSNSRGGLRFGGGIGSGVTAQHSNTIPCMAATATSATNGWVAAEHRVGLNSYHGSTAGAGRPSSNWLVGGTGDTDPDNDIMARSQHQQQQQYNHRQSSQLTRNDAITTHNSYRVSHSSNTTTAYSSTLPRSNSNANANSGSNSSKCLIM